MSTHTHIWFRSPVSALDFGAVGISFTAGLRRRLAQNVRLGRRHSMRFIPEPGCDRHWIKSEPAPPFALVPGTVQLAVVAAAKRDGKFVADFAAQRRCLGKAQVMRIRSGGLINTLQRNIVIKLGSFCQNR